MRNRVIAIAVLAAWVGMSGCTEEGAITTPAAIESNLSGGQLVELAQCLTERGWVVYVSFTCSACRFQRSTFREAFSFIQDIECNPTADDAEPERCLEARLTETPTWILERDGTEVQRLAGYRSPEELAAQSACETVL